MDDIEKFIKSRGYTYTKEQVIKEYKEKYGIYYISYTMRDCIEQNIEHLKK